MSEQAPIFVDAPLAHGLATAEGQTFVTVDTGVTLGGTPIYRLEMGVPTGAELLVEDGAMEFEFDDATGDVLYEG